MNHLTQFAFNTLSHWMPVLAAIFFGMIFASSEDSDESEADRQHDWYMSESNKDGYWKGKGKF